MNKRRIRALKATLPYADGLIARVINGRPVRGVTKGDVRRAKKAYWRARRQPVCDPAPRLIKQLDRAAARRTSRRRQPVVVRLREAQR